MSSSAPSPSVARRPAPPALIAAALALATLAGPAAATSGAAASSGDHATPRVVAGTAVTVATVPYQARIRVRLDGAAWDDASASRMIGCGAIVLSKTTVLTAMHCVVNGKTPIGARAIVVDTGSSRYDTDPAKREAPKPLTGDTPQTRRVTLVRRHPGYPNPGGGPATRDQRADDVAVLTLASPLTLDGNTKPVPLAAPGAPQTAGVARASGFGLQSGGATSPNGRLYVLDTQLIDPGLTPGWWESTNALWVGTTTPAGSLCEGDSGGPLVQNGQLIGVFSSMTLGCPAGAQNTFTSTSAPEVRDFVLGNSKPARAPRGGSDVLLSGSARAGDALTCAPGTWSDAPSLGLVFFDTRDGTVLQSGPSTTYVLGDGDVGRTVSCRSVATTAGGIGRSPRTGITPPVAPRPAPPAPTVPSAARLKVQANAGASRVRRRGRVAFVIAVDNVGDTPARSVRTCVTVGSRFVVSSRHGGTLRRGRLCWQTKELERRTLKRFVVRAKSNARRGRTTAVRVKATATSVHSASTSRRLTVR
ncbi:trypsin-like serine protease [Patulibacter sp. NPDC049589]|uniref:S1 family peptidase n=1 Tax=Patulibacter sp. NPDC049589 TaxID=3154731 RepID=UPI003429D5B1